ncbi:nucleoside deaminase [Saccharicrinis fermentans]|uniref:Guanine deaminase n=1 Tax=Saccharicrinis fermentans DSM 9555 = JCM 21142 TaxID=869213 RepID=W7YAY5_9BACT|nr:nucleoside deaminase [Saccharicrinis fermentans]GAF04778.1 guanine deaminase [Saccharicrinis fermentans DSM 9555 = JCM 21142]
MNKHKEYMARAIELSVYNVERGGGPFGAVIVKDGEIVGEGFNEVTASNDPTAHAEVVAIRNAARKLQNFDLSGCTIYTSCEPCPMCLGAIYWAKIARMYYGNTKSDADRIGFNDDFIYREIDKPLGERQLFSEQLMREEALVAFRLWKDSGDKTEY